MYTHKLYTDGLGSSKPIVLTSWTHGKYSRKVNLFPPKMTTGYSGHRFIVAAANQPPYIFRRYFSTMYDKKIDVKYLHPIEEPVLFVTVDIF